MGNRKLTTRILTVSALFGAVMLATAAHAGSDASFPEGWENWLVVKEGAIPDNQTALPADLPAIVRETVKTYNWINDGKGSPYRIRVNPAVMDAYAKRGPYDTHSSAVLELTSAKALLVTEHMGGQPLYGAFSVDGKDIAEAHPSLAPQVCTTCHTGFEDACTLGICSQPKP